MARKSKYLVEYKDRSIKINSSLVKQKKINDETLNKIKELHLSKLKIFDEIENYKIETGNDIVILHKLANKLTEIEFQLQELWGFNKDADFHRFWLTPKCICPKMDNEENYGDIYSIISDNCPLHGKYQLVQKVIDKKPGWRVILNEDNSFDVIFSFFQFIKDIFKF